MQQAIQLNFQLEHVGMIFKLILRAVPTPHLGMVLEIPTSKNMDRIYQLNMLQEIPTDIPIKLKQTESLEKLRIHGSRMMILCIT